MCIRFGLRMGLHADSDSDDVLGPTDLIVSGDRIAWHKSDTGITESSSRISAWTDVWGNNDNAQATGGNQPLYETNQLGSYPAVHLDDGNRFLTGALTSGIASGERLWQWCFMRLSATAAATRYISMVANAGQARASALTLSSSGGGRFGSFNNVAGTGFNSFAPGVQDLVPHLFEAGNVASSITGYLSGASFGTSVGTFNQALTDTWFGHPTPTISAPVRIFERVIMRGIPTAEVRQRMSLYFLRRYGTI